MPVAVAALVPDAAHAARDAPAAAAGRRAQEPRRRGRRVPRVCTCSCHA